MHIVPLDYASAPSEKYDRRRLTNVNSDNEEEEDLTNSDYITFSDGVRSVRDPKVDTFASEEIENAAFKRVQKFGY